MRRPQGALRDNHVVFPGQLLALLGRTTPLLMRRDFACHWSIYWSAGEASHSLLLFHLVDIGTFIVCGGRKDRQNLHHPVEQRASFNER